MRRVLSILFLLTMLNPAPWVHANTISDAYEDILKDGEAVFSNSVEDRKSLKEVFSDAFWFLLDVRE